MITNQKFVAVKEIDANEFAKIQATLVKHKNIELKKMVELYWVANFLRDQGNLASPKKTNSTVQDQIADINEFYDKRQFELTQTYDFINKGRTELIKSTHDDCDPVEKILNWKPSPKLVPYIFCQKLLI